MFCDEFTLKKLASPKCSCILFKRSLGRIIIKDSFYISFRLRMCFSRDQENKGVANTHVFLLQRVFLLSIGIKHFDLSRLWCCQGNFQVRPIEFHWFMSRFEV